MRILAATIISASFSASLCGQCVLTEDQLLIGDANARYGGFGGETTAQPLALYQDVLVVGAPTKNRVDVFRHDGVSWTLEQQLFGVGNFGFNVSLLDDSLLIGAPGDNGVGAAHLFKHNGTSWVLNHKFLASDGAFGDRFAEGVAADGPWLAVGAPETLSGGAVYVYRRESGFWVETRVSPDEAQAFRLFGTSLSFSGQGLLVGAPGEEVEGTANAGTVYCFEQTGSTWVERSRITSPSPSSQQRFGVSIAATDTRLAVGTSSPDPNQGAVYCYSHDGATWLFDQELSSSPYWDYGSALSISENILLVGQRRALNEGRCWAYHRSGSKWRLFGDLRHSQTGSNGTAGHSVFIAGDTAVVADPDIRSGAGLVGIFDLPRLVLEVTPFTPRDGDTLIFETCRGLAGELAALTLVELNGTPTFDIVTMGAFDANGKWSIQATVPPGLAGLETTFQSIGFVANRKLELSNQVPVEFR